MSACDMSGENTITFGPRSDAACGAALAAWTGATMPNVAAATATAMPSGVRPRPLLERVRDGSEDTVDLLSVKQRPRQAREDAGVLGSDVIGRRSGTREAYARHGCAR